MLATEALGAPPVRTRLFASSSGRTAIVYFTYASGPCGGALTCNFRGPIKVPPGFAQTEVFLSGVEWEAAGQADPLSQVAATVQRLSYDSTAGALEIGINASLTTQTRQSYSYILTFVVILTQAGVASFVPISTGCAGVGNCRIVRSVPGAVPAGMKYIGLATYNWHLGTQGGDILLNALSGHQDGLKIAPPNVDVEYRCVMQDARARNRMFCEWGAKVIAFDPSEMEQNGSTIFPQYTFLGLNTPNRHAWINQSASPSQAKLSGFLDAFEGLSLWYATGMQNAVWRIESSAKNHALTLSAPGIALTEYGMFLGTAFGNSVGAASYSYQESRAFGFLK
jgi:hypothetical protein